MVTTSTRCAPYLTRTSHFISGYPDHIGVHYYRDYLEFRIVNSMTVVGAPGFKSTTRMVNTHGVLNSPFTKIKRPNTTIMVLPEVRWALAPAAASPGTYSGLGYRTESVGVSVLRVPHLARVCLLASCPITRRLSGPTTARNTRLHHHPFDLYTA